MSALFESSIPGLPVRRGKVRDVYELPDEPGGKLLIVASDRISAFDVIMPTPIPDKGRVLTALSNFWFHKFAREIPAFRHHLLATSWNEFPASVRALGGGGLREMLEGRSVIVRKTSVVPIECVARGYLTGSGWKDYQQTGAVSGVNLPAGLRQCEQLPAPIFTPSTKAAAGHDEPISFDAAAARVGTPLMERCRSLTLDLYQRAAAYARQRGILLADTKFEFGTLPDASDQPLLIDEALTPDSSRFWPADEYQVGRDQPSFDKQYLRNYLETLAWTKSPPGPVLPDEVVALSREKYIDAYERLTGTPFVEDDRSPS
ncbi:MAG TPA: phosphoribosylaminoimidazolesuccinocarboxamide synthase [Phycisphaerae bacterium]|nr:phosphoribosylaminoimidazolesuccinocarboxamide synthase [Phycisphaerae bacterium]